MTAMRGLAFFAWSLLTLLGCRAEPFACESSEQCLDGEREGACEPNGYCSFDDDTCPSGRRYGHLAGGGLAERCVSSDGNATTEVSSSTGSSTSGPSTSGPSTSASTTSPVTSASTITTSSSGAPADSSTGPTLTTSVDDTSTSVGDTAADASPCRTNADCQSSHCFDVGILGAVCGECTDDDDCRWGCTPPPFDINGASSGSYCNDGSLGEGCQSASSCVDLTCAFIYSLEGIGTVAACSECAATKECPGGTVCNPTIDISTGYGYRSCIEPGAADLGDFCDNQDAGHLACGSGYCVDANLMGLGTMGICSECSTAEHCATGQECVPPQIDIFMGTNIPGSCQ